MSNGNAPWRNEELLYQKYVVEELSSNELGELWDCDGQTVLNWLKRYDIDRRDNAPNPDAPYRDKELMERLYVDEEMSMSDIAQKLGYSKGCIRRWVNRHGIETRKSNREKPPTHTFKEDGYEVMYIYDSGSYHQIRIHRLIAIAHGKLAPSDFKNREIDIHHKNGVPWDNRPENIKSISRKEHAELHTKEFEATEG
jgi:transposase-like protein